MKYVFYAVAFLAGLSLGMAMGSNLIDQERAFRRNDRHELYERCVDQLGGGDDAYCQCSVIFLEQVDCY